MLSRYPKVTTLNCGTEQHHAGSQRPPPSPPCPCLRFLEQNGTQGGGGTLMALCKHVLVDPSQPFVAWLLFSSPVANMIFIKY